MTQGAITLSDIKSADWSLMLDSLGLPGSGMGKVVKGVDDVDQCIAQATKAVVTVSGNADTLSSACGGVGAPLPVPASPCGADGLNWKAERPTMAGDSM